MPITPSMASTHTHWQLGIPPASATATCPAETLVKFTGAKSTLQPASTITVSLRNIKTRHRLGNQPTNQPSMKHRPSRKGTDHPVNMNSPYLWNSKMNCRAHNSPPHVHILTHMNPVRAVPRYEACSKRDRTLK